MSINALLNYRFWLNPGPPSLSGTYLYSILLALGLVLVAYIIIRLYLAKKNHTEYKKLLNKIGHLSITIVIIGYIWTFFANQGIPYLSMRIWILFLAIGAAVWSLFIIKYFLKDLPKEREEKRKKKQFAKYLPKSK
jgi:predicted membrane channel-forming protein YqfA (hemolysin III family)